MLPLTRRCGASAKRHRSELLLNFVTLIQAMRSEREARAERALIIFSYPYQGDAERARSASVASPYYIFLPLSRRCGASAKRERSEPLLYLLTLFRRCGASAKRERSEPLLHF